MARTPACRKILVFEDKPSIDNALGFLLAGLGYGGGIAYGDRKTLGTVRRDSFDAVLLDLRCPEVPRDRAASHLGEVRPSLVGRVLVLTGEVRDSQTMQIIERECAPRLGRKPSLKHLVNAIRPVASSSKTN